jgi:hypothetical protein
MSMALTLKRGDVQEGFLKPVSCFRKGDTMDAEIHAVDTEKQSSEGNHLAVRGAQLEVSIKPVGGLPFGEHKDQHYIEVRASSWEGTTHSTLVAQLNAADLQRLFDFAVAEGMVTAPVDTRIIRLVEQLREAVMIKG